VKNNFSPEKNFPENPAKLRQSCKTNKKLKNASVVRKSNFSPRRGEASDAMIGRKKKFQWSVPDSWVEGSARSLHLPDST
jgi:hypothetical protein